MEPKWNWSNEEGLLIGPRMFQRRPKLVYKRIGKKEGPTPKELGIIIGLIGLTKREEWKPFLNQ